MTGTLEPLEPEEVVALYLAQKRDNASERTVQAHRYRLKHFLRWCEKENITNLNTLSGRSLQQFRLWRRDDGDLNTVSLRTQLSTLRAFIRFCETIDGVEKDLHDKIVLALLLTTEKTPETTLSKQNGPRRYSTISVASSMLRGSTSSLHYSGTHQCVWERVSLSTRRILTVTTRVSQSLRGITLFGEPEGGDYRARIEHLLSFARL